jgi:sporulation protein YlmC with PRC-barrel domain
MKKNIFLMVILLLVMAFALTACDAVQTRRERNENLFNSEQELIPDTRGAANNHNDNEDRVFDDYRSSNDNRNANDNEARVLPVTGGHEFDRANLYRAKRFTGYPIYTQSGEYVGEVEGLLVHPTTGMIHYLVLDPADELERDHDHLLVAWGAVQHQRGRAYGYDDDRGRGRGGPEGIPPGHLPPPGEREPMDCRELPPGHLPPPAQRNELCLDYDEDEIYDAFVLHSDWDFVRSAPGFDDDDLDNMRAGDWDTEAAGYWRAQVETVPELDEEGRQRGYLFLTDDDYRLVTRDGSGAGEVSDLLFHLPSSQVQYAVVEPGGLFESGYTVIPFNQLNWSGEEDAFVLNADEDELERFPRYDDEEALPVTDRLW